MLEFDIQNPPKKYEIINDNNTIKNRCFFITTLLLLGILLVDTEFKDTFFSELITTLLLSITLIIIASIIQYQYKKKDLSKDNKIQNVISFMSENNNKVRNYIKQVKEENREIKDWEYKYLFNYFQDKYKTKKPTFMGLVFDINIPFSQKRINMKRRILKERNLKLTIWTAFLSGITLTILFFSPALSIITTKEPAILFGLGTLLLYVIDNFIILIIVWFIDSEINLNGYSLQNISDEEEYYLLSINDNKIQNYIEHVESKNRKIVDWEYAQLCKYVKQNAKREQYAKV